MRGDGVRVLVVGAGIAGLAAARTLHEWGASVEVIDRQPTSPLEGTGIFLPGNSVRALGALGLGDEVAGRAAGIHRQRTLDHRGRTLFEVEADELWHGVAPCLALSRADLHQALLAGVGDVPVRWGESLEAVAFDDVGVTVTVGGTPTLYDLVLGADGVHSTVRQLTFGPGAVRKVGQYARRFVVEGDVEPATWSVRLGPGSAFLTIPIGDGRSTATSMARSTIPGPCATCWPATPTLCRPARRARRPAPPCRRARSRRSCSTPGRGTRCC